MGDMADMIDWFGSYPDDDPDMCLGCGVNRADYFRSNLCPQCENAGVDEDGKQCRHSCECPDCNEQ